MPRCDLTLEVTIERTARAIQLEGMFDVPESKRRTVDFHFDVPIEERDWKIGLIIGPSGAGKSSVANHLFGDAVVKGYEWDPRKSLVDSFPNELSIRDVTAALSSVGFSSPPSWLKPFRVLSNGEQFRATLARALVDTRELVVFDEFTSVVDRTVARIGSAAVAKVVRRGSKRFVAVTCHEDVTEWLQPDWILEPHAGRFAWRSLQRRPPIELEIRRIGREVWPLFAPHHYLSADLNKSAHCFGAFIDGRIVGFAAFLPFVGRLRDGARGKRVHRVVCLPDYQGIGIGKVLIDTLAAAYTAREYRIFLVTSHPGEIQSRSRSENWLLRQHRFHGRDGGEEKVAKRSIERRTASFVYRGSADPRAAQALNLGS